MRIKDIYLKNIGPFEEAELQFINGDIAKPPITIITGENGTGKTIVLDAIRSMLFGEYGQIERNIIREEDFSINLTINEDYNKINSPELSVLKSVKYEPIPFKIQTNLEKFNFQFIEYKFLKETKTYDGKIPTLFLASPGEAPKQPNWITNYWTSKNTSDNFNIKKLITPDINNYLFNSLSGVQRNVEVIELITFFDYLKDAASSYEKETGIFFYDTIKNIIKLSLDKGEFGYVKRTDLQPVIIQNDREITIDKLSSGNLYLIQRMISLLGQMYAVHQIHNTPFDKICETPGLLLIDEAENHLHPKWQKTFLNSILDIFPNLQIIATTHSPFIVSSVKNANVYVCKSMKDHSIVENKTAEYSNKPIEEILLSPVFNTSSFNTEISELIAERKQAIEKGNTKVAENIKKKLKEINPEYFSYFDVEDILKEISK